MLTSQTVLPNVLLHISLRAVSLLEEPYLHLSFYAFIDVSVVVSAEHGGLRWVGLAVVVVIRLISESPVAV
jgi:hypothetical protein